MKIVLMGLPAAGKTSVGLELSRKSGGRWLDLDHEIEAQAGRTVSEIIRVEGEERFRELETEALRTALESSTDEFALVLSVGGGIVLRPENRELLSRRATSIFLTAGHDTLLRRALDDEAATGEKAFRPLLRASAKLDASEISSRLGEIVSERSALYNFAPLKVWSDFATPDKIGALIESEIKSVAMEKSIHIPMCGELNGDIVIGSQLLTGIGERMKSLAPDAKRFVVISDEVVFRNYGEKLIAALAGKSAEKSAISTHIVPAGETSKALHLVEKISAEMLTNGVARGDVVLALGGGVVGDLGGLVASLYMRGIELIQIPTTVVAQVDSAIGGKTGVNLKGGKNIVGTFYPAKLIVCDVDVLSTLPEREYRSGIAEVVKYGAIVSEGFFGWLEANVEKVLRRESEALLYVVESCASMKLQCVSGDLRDLAGRRALLNFGHTVGHALEAVTEYERFLHGEAVAIGMVCAARISAACSEKESSREIGLIEERLKQLLEKLGLPTEIPEEVKAKTSQDRWRAAVVADKKRTGDVMQFVALSKIGHAKILSISVADIVKNI